MKHTIRTKLFILVVVSTFAFLLNIATNLFLIKNAQSQVSLIQNQIIPKIELGSVLQSEFKKLQRQFQDSVASTEEEGILETLKSKDIILENIIKSKDLLGKEMVEELKESISNYYNSVANISLRLIKGESGEEIVANISNMQVLQANTTALIEKATKVSPNELKNAFIAVEKAQGKVSLLSIYVGIFSLLVIFSLFLWFSRGVIRSMSVLTEGLIRFGGGDLSIPIPVVGNDDISYASQLANDMAKKLEKEKIKREREYHLKDLLTQLSTSLRGDLSPKAVSNIIIKFLGQNLKTGLANLYYIENEKLYRLESFEDEEKQPKFVLGEGIVGQASMRSEMSFIKNSEQNLESSGVSPVSPKEIVYVPLHEMNEVTGLLELEFFTEHNEEIEEFLQESSRIIATAMNVSISRKNIENLLVQSQNKSQKLMEQEEELQASNEELESQRTELEETNHELEKQREILENEKEKLEHLTHELEVSRQEVEEKAIAAEKASRYKSQFLANMSHELRTPLNSIMVLSQLLSENKETSLSKEQIKCAKTIHSSGKDLLNLINDILDLAKIEAGKMEVSPGTVNLESVAERMDSIFGPEAKGKGLEFILEMDPSCPKEFATDQKRLEQILKNLLANAIKFTELGSIKLRFESVTDMGKELLKISVHDTGIGIASDKLDLIFDAFEQSDGSIDRKYSGTGLGLTISRSLAAKLGGSLNVKSTAGKGSIFTLVIAPLEDSEDISETTIKLNKKSDTEMFNNKRQVLLVGLEKQESEFVREHFEKIGIVIDETNDPVESRRKLLSNNYGCIVIHSMYSSELLSYLEFIKEQNTSESTPIIVITEDFVAPEVKKKIESVSAAVILKNQRFSQSLLDEISVFVLREERKLSNSINVSGDEKENNLAGKKVLIAEDDVRNIFTLRQILLPLGMKVFSVENGLEALRLLQSDSKFDVILMDIMMPVMDGIEAIKRIRENEKFKNLPIIAITAKAMKKDREDCIAAGASDYLSKPIDVEQLLRLLTIWLS